MSTLRTVKRSLIRGEGVRYRFQVKECTQKLGVDIVVAKTRMKNGRIETKTPRCNWHTTSGCGSRKRRKLGKLVK